MESKKVFRILKTFFYVGVVRLELTTPCTPCKYASQLRHTPPLVFLQKYTKFYNKKLKFSDNQLEKNIFHKYVLIFKFLIILHCLIINNKSL
jgi:hypothetical protein